MQTHMGKWMTLWMPVVLLLACNETQLSESSSRTNPSPGTVDPGAVGDEVPNDLPVIPTPNGAASVLATAADLATQSCEAATFGNLFFILEEHKFYHCDAATASFQALDLTGAVGSVGSQGAAGLAGIQGLKGTAGEDGDQGEKGDQGEAGESLPPFASLTQTEISVFKNSVEVGGQHFVTSSETNFLFLPAINAEQMLITTFPNCNDTLWMDFKASTHFPLTEGASTVFYFKFKDPDGNESACFQSDASITLDQTPPVVDSFSFTDGLNATSDLSSTPTMSWTSNMLDATSGVKTYEIKIGTAKGGGDVLDWTDIEQNTSPYTHTGLSLESGKQYHLSIRAVDHVGNKGPAYHRAPFVTKLSGVLDSGFRGVGTASFGGGAGANGPEKAEDVVVDSQDRMILVGRGYNGSNEDVIVMRFLSDGSLDKSFAGDGIKVLKSAVYASANNYAYAVAVDAQDRIVVAGNSSNSNNNDDLSVWRILPNGSLDTDFNSVGSFHHDGAGGVVDTEESVTSLAIDDSGNIFIGGYSFNSVHKAVVWKLDSSGSLVNGFDSNGFHAIELTGGLAGLETKFNDIALTADGGIVAVGVISSNSDDVLIAKFKSDGSLDSDFADAGLKIIHNVGGGGTVDDATSVIIDSNQKIALSGYTMGLAYPELFVIRLLQNGSEDDSFSDDGKVHYVPAGAVLSAGRDLIEDSLGNIYVAGFVDLNLGAQWDAGIWAFDSTGGIITDFGDSGMLAVNHVGGAAGIGGHGDEATGMAFDSYGRLSVAVISYGAIDADMAIMRVR